MRAVARGDDQRYHQALSINRLGPKYQRIGRRQSLVVIGAFGRAAEGVPDTIQNWRPWIRGVSAAHLE
jgi:hypothetical protein